MRLLQITLLAFTSLTLIVNYSDSAIAAVSKSSKSKSHKRHGQSKSKKRAAKTGSGDVWERIRLGLRMPRPRPASAGFDPIKVSLGRNLPVTSTQAKIPAGTVQARQGDTARMTTVITPKKLLSGESQLTEKLRKKHVLLPKGREMLLEKSPEEKYTRLGRLKLGAKNPMGDNLFKSPSVQRIRSRLGLHPELFKHGDVAQNFATDKKTGITGNIKDQQSVAVRNCADLNKKEFTNLAKQGFLPDGYSQLAEQCRIQQDANYERMSRHIAGYSPGYLQQVSERARPYLYHIANELSKHGLPMDLALLPIVESAYQPTALSNKAAAGIWQFIPSTGLEYGLEQNNEYDARLDITASTHAAIRFLSGLNGHFRGDWLLSLAAYNCGQGAVDAAISRNQAEGLPTDFWSLDLPAETKDYVPRLLALSAIFASPSSYGLKLRSVKNEPYFIKVNIDRATDINHLANKELRTVAKLADFDPEQFGLLNTAYLNSTLPGNKPFTLLMPIGNANLLHQSLAFMAQSNKEGKKKAPSLLAELALSGEPSESKIQLPLLSLSLNKDQQWALSKGQFREFNVKPKSTEDILTAQSTDDAYWAVHYLDKGESLQDVAESHGITEEVLRVANKFKSRQNITLGQRLSVPIKQMVAATMKKTRTSVLFRGI